MPAKCIVIGLNQALYRDITRYFSVYNTLPPNDLRIDTVTRSRCSATFETLLNALISSGVSNILVVAYGYHNGRGIYLPLVQGANITEGSRGRTTKQYLSRLMRMACARDGIQSVDLHETGAGLVICFPSMRVSAKGETPKNRICRCTVSCDISHQKGLTILLSTYTNESIRYTENI